jgi:hypothetical protein
LTSEYLLNAEAVRVEVGMGAILGVEVTEEVFLSGKELRERTSQNPWDP